MDARLRILLVASAAAAICSGAGAQGSSRTTKLNIAVKDKVSAVYWVTDSPACALQISFQPVRQGRGREPATPPPARPQTEAWLLTADGGVIPHASQNPVLAGISKSGEVTPLAIYAFSCAAASAAVAAVVEVDGEFFVDKLGTPGS
jgi:hypothetical protein